MRSAGWFSRGLINKNPPAAAGGFQLVDKVDKLLDGDA